MSNQVLERFHRALIEEIQTQRPEYLTGPFTVAEIYQNLVPYGSHRDRIGVEMNGDYEDALLRLLSGEGGYLLLDSEPALKALRAEAERPNPNTGIYREFAAVDVRLNQAYLDLSAAALDQLPDLVRELEADDPVAVSDLAPTTSHGDLGIVPPGVDIFADPEPPAPVVDEVVAAREAEDLDDPPIASNRPPLAPEFVEPDPEPEPPAAHGHRMAGGACLWCGEDLPERSPLNYCPFCGTDQSLVPCTACGSEIEPGWKFCVACGATTEASEVGG